MFKPLLILLSLTSTMSWSVVNMNDTTIFKKIGKVEIIPIEEDWAGANVFKVPDLYQSTLSGNCYLRSPNRDTPIISKVACEDFTGEDLSTERVHAKENKRLTGILEKLLTEKESQCKYGREFGRVVSEDGSPAWLHNFKVTCSTSKELEEYERLKAKYTLNEEGL